MDFNIIKYSISVLFKSGGRKDWPESLQKLYTEQTKRSREMTETHLLEMIRIQQMEQKEIGRSKEAERRTKSEDRRSFMTVGEFD